MQSITTGGNPNLTGYLTAFAAFISSLDVSIALSVGSFILAIAMFLMTWAYRHKDFELKRRRLEHDIQSRQSDDNG